MDNGVTGQTAQSHLGGPLSVAVDRLDRALESLESRLKTIASGPSAAAGIDLSDQQQILAELETVRAREKALEAAAADAYEALGVAAANIRILLQSDAA